MPEEALENAQTENCRQTLASIAAAPDLLQQWRDKAHHTVMVYMLAIDLSPPPSEFQRQPPEHVVVINLNFNYNLGTFMPVQAPLAVPLGSLEDGPLHQGINKPEGAATKNPMTVLPICFTLS